MKTTHHGYFGDGEYTFRLTVPLILELERKTGAGIAALCERVFRRQFAHSDLIETIRLSLVGGGTAPKRADELVTAFAVDRPLIETHPLAVAILEAVWFGTESKDENIGQA